MTREASINLWAWYHRKNNPFFVRDSWGRQNDRTTRALLDFVTFVFSVDVSSAFTESVFSITKGTKDQKRQRLSTEQVANYVRLGALQRVPARRIPPKVLALNTWRSRHTAEMCLALAPLPLATLPAAIAVDMTTVLVEIPTTMVKTATIGPTTTMVTKLVRYCNRINWSN